MNATSANTWLRSYGKRGILDGDLSSFLKKPRRDSIKGAMMQRLQSEPVTNGQLSAAQIAQWRNMGRVLVKGLLDSDQLRALTALALQLFPAPDAAEAASVTDFGSDGALVFPSAHVLFNDVTLSPPLLQAVADLLGVGVDQIRLTQSDLWPKYGRALSASERDNRDQRMHVDYPNHTMLHPPIWQAPEAVEMIIYHSDARECSGETAVVPKLDVDDVLYRYPILDAPGIGELVYVNDREAAEAYLSRVAPEVANFRRQLYAREQLVDYRPYDVLFYRHDTWHRGTPIKEGTCRLAHNVTFRLASAEWVSTLHPGWAWSAYRPSQVFERWLAQASVPQRTVLGFPHPGHAYWTPATVAAVAARYGAFGFDSAPYVSAMSKGLQA